MNEEFIAGLRLLAFVRDATDHFGGGCKADFVEDKQHRAEEEGRLYDEGQKILKALGIREKG